MRRNRTRAVFLRARTPTQVENAAEVGIEHNPAPTCGPVSGLAQIPCIERNATASVKHQRRPAWPARGRKPKKIAGKAIKSMLETGADMKTGYKETSRGCLPVNVIEG